MGNSPLVMGCLGAIDSGQENLVSVREPIAIVPKLSVNTLSPCPGSADLVLLSGSVHFQPYEMKTVLVNIIFSLSSPYRTKRYRRSPLEESRAQAYPLWTRQSFAGAVCAAASCLKLSVNQRPVSNAFVSTVKRMQVLLLNWCVAGMLRGESLQGLTTRHRVQSSTRTKSR